MPLTVESVSGDAIWGWFCCCRCLMVFSLLAKAGGGGFVVANVRGTEIFGQVGYL